MPSVNINKVKLEYNEQGSGEPVVFVHGGLSDWRTWIPQLEQFSIHYRTISYSRRYHWPNAEIADQQDNPMNPHVSDLATFLRTMDATPVHLIGNSWGAFICLLLALRQPQLVQTLVLCEPPVLPIFLKSPGNPLEMLSLFLRRPKTANAIMKFVSKGYGPAVNAFKRGENEKGLEYFAQSVLGKSAYENVPEDRKEQMRANLKPQIAEMVYSVFPSFSEPDARSIKIPTLLVTGENSPDFLLRLSARLNEIMPHAEKIVIPEASHMMHEQNPQAFNEAVLEFLARH